MKTISLKVPERMHAKLRSMAKRLGRSKSEVVRAALEQFLNGEAAAQRPISALELAGDLVGCAPGPADLSTNPEYMEGYGK
jgi:Arc/MetJ-type ribon-helix-helix transcriptional regulator